jgi:transposase InsO family protein
VNVESGGDRWSLGGVREGDEMPRRGRTEEQIIAAWRLSLPARVVGWATSERLTDSLAHAALQRALTERHVGTDLVHHTDQGSQYTSASYQRLMRAHGLTVSMSRKGDCWDNAVVESFFATLKVELGDRFPSRALAHDALFEYIEIFYNRARMHSSIGFISPAEAEARFDNEAAA